MADDSQGIEKKEEFGPGEDAVARRWKQELTLARKGSHRTWMNRAKKAIRRYRDEDPSSDSKPGRRNAQFNVLWSNIATTAPAVYSRPPVPIVERRFLDRDVVARAAATILQRSLAYQIEASNLHETMKQCRLDLQLVAYCSAWVRYEAQYEKDQTAPKMQAEIEGDKPEGGVSDEEALRVSDEKLCVDYSHWSDELVSAARFWSEVTWRAKRAPFTRRQLEKLSPEHGKLCPLDTVRSEKKGADVVEPTRDLFGKAWVWQIWDFEERKTIWLCEEYDGPPLKVADDLLDLRQFTPAARPARATTTNDSIWPIPDYEVYYDQAKELDSLTARIAALTRAIKACGVFDSSIPELERMLSEGIENRLIGTKNWAKLTQKGGLAGSISLLPIKEFSEALTALYMARGMVKQDLYEISGTSDILRGATNPNETAKAQQLKGQYSGMRLEDRRSEFNRFVKETLLIMAEIICEWFSADTIWLMSDFEQWAKDQDLRAWAAERFPQPPAMGHNGGPPLDDMGAPGAMMPPSTPATPPGAPGQALQPSAPAGISPQVATAASSGSAPMASAPVPPPVPGVPVPGMQAQPPAPSITPKQAARALFDEALTLLRNDKLRSFRIDIETDSTITQDMQQEKQDRTEFITAVTQFLAQATEMGAAYPQLMPVLGKFLLFGARGFRVGRELESSLENMIADLEKQARNPKPKPPSPDEIKAKAAADQNQAKLQQIQAKGQQDQQKFQLEIQKMVAEMQAMREEMQIEREKMQMELQALQEKLAIKREEGQISLSLKQQEGQIAAQQGAQQMALDQEAAGLERERMHSQAEFDERKLERTEQHDEHKMAMANRTAAAKAKQAESRSRPSARGGGGKA